MEFFGENKKIVEYACLCGILSPLTKLYFCRHCLNLRCAFCCHHEVSGRTKRFQIDFMTHFTSAGGFALLLELLGEHSVVGGQAEEEQVQHLLRLPVMHVDAVRSRSFDPGSDDVEGRGWRRVGRELKDGQQEDVLLVVPGVPLDVPRRRHQRPNFPNLLVARTRIFPQHSLPAAVGALSGGGAA